jgi:hypothetical protein
MKKRSIGLCLGVLVIIGLHSFVVQAADRAYFTADKMTVLIGEQTQLILHLHVPQNAQLNLPDLTRSLSPFTVENVGPLNLVQQFDDGSVEYEVLLKVLLWRTGTYKTPPLTVSYKLADTPTINLIVEPLQFEVPSILKDDDLTLRPLKPLVNLPYFPLWEIFALIVVIFGVTFVFVRKHLTKIRKRSSSLGDMGISGYPEVVYALKALKQIEQSNDDTLAIYVQVSDCLRQYLSKRYSIQALDLTTSELNEKLSEKALFADEHQQKLTEMLKRADLVKFARVIPKQGAAQQYSVVASQWILAVEQANVEQPS